MAQNNNPPETPKEPFELPQFHRESLSYPFDIEKYVEEQTKELKQKYTVMWKEMMDALERDYNKGVEKCVIEIGARNGNYGTSEDSWKNNMHNVELRAIENFIYYVRSKGYMCVEHFTTQYAAQHFAKYVKVITITLK